MNEINWDLSAADKRIINKIVNRVLGSHDDIDRSDTFEWCAVASS